MYNPVEYKIALGRVVKFITSRGYTVNLKSNSFYLIEEDRIVAAPHNASGYNMICSLLHEAGHIVQSTTEFKLLRSTLKRNKAIILEQEYQAWMHGWNISIELNLNTPELYIYYRKSWLAHWSTYIEAVTHPDNTSAIKEWSKPFTDVLDQLPLSLSIEKSRVDTPLNQG